MHRVSVIIATYNRPHLLPRAVESARRAGRDVEIVVVDDASGEGTHEVCRGLSGVRYLRVERTVEMLWIASQPGIDEYFRKLSVPVGAPPRQFTAQEIEEIQRKHGVRRKVP